jgi:outer membrane biosynthesis protein TonB
MRAVAVLVALTLGLVAVPRPVTSQASAEPPIRITGNNIVPPTKVKDVPPVYPPEARQSGVSGVVIIEATIGERGPAPAAPPARPPARPPHCPRRARRPGS